MNIVQKLKLLLQLRSAGKKVQKMSKKQLMTILGAGLVAFITTVSNQLGLSEDLVKWLAGLVAGMVGTYNVGQGIADHGKEAEKEKTARAKLGGMPGQE